VPTYRAEEKHGIIWATSAADAAMPELADASGSTCLRSLNVDSPLQDVQAALDRRGFTKLGENAGTCTINSTLLFIGLQVANAQRTVLHMVVPAAANAAMLKQLSRWAEDFRFALESPELAAAEVA
jgi:hypothetical protein